MKKIELSTTIFEYDNIEELSEQDQLLIKKSKEAAKKAYAPYSNFNVGASILLENGEIVEGNNQENAAYPSGLCAERVALFYANSKYPDVPVKTIAISVFTKNQYIEFPIPPCGSCRQVILETENRFKKPIKLILYGSKKIHIISDAAIILPFAFKDEMMM